MLTTAQAGEALGLTQKSIAQFIRRGVLKADKFGRDWMISEQEVERYRAGRRPAGRPRKDSHVMAPSTDD